MEIRAAVNILNARERERGSGVNRGFSQTVVLLGLPLEMEREGGREGNREGREREGCGAVPGRLKLLISGNGGLRQEGQLDAEPEVDPRKEN